MEISKKLVKSDLGNYIERLIRAKKESSFIINVLSKKGIDLSKLEINSLATLSAHKGNIILFDYFVKELKVDPVLRSGKFLMIAVTRNNVELVNYLLGTEKFDKIKTTQMAYAELFKFKSTDLVEMMKVFWKNKSFSEMYKELDLKNYITYSVFEKVKNF